MGLRFSGEMGSEVGGPHRAPSTLGHVPGPPQLPHWTGVTHWCQDVRQKLGTVRGWRGLAMRQVSVKVKSMILEVTIDKGEDFPPKLYEVSEILIPKTR